MTNTETQIPETTAPEATAPEVQDADQLDLPRLKALSDELASYPATSSLTDVGRRFEVEEGMQTEGDRDKGFVVTLAGISAKSRTSPVEALRNWGNKARRVIAKGGA